MSSSDFDFEFHKELVSVDTQNIYVAVHHAIEYYQMNPMTNIDKISAIQAVQQYAQQLYVVSGGDWGDFCFEMISKDIIENDIDSCMETKVEPEVSYLSWIFGLIA